MDIVLDIEIYQVENLISETVWLEEKGEGPVSSMSQRLSCISENMTGTDQDNGEIDSRLQVFSCCENSVVP
jgi:hypothetical protein